MQVDGNYVYSLLVICRGAYIIKIRKQWSDGTSVRQGKDWCYDATLRPSLLAASAPSPETLPPPLRHYTVRKLILPLSCFQLRLGEAVSSVSESVISLLVSVGKLVGRLEGGDKFSLLVWIALWSFLAHFSARCWLG